MQYGISHFERKSEKQTRCVLFNSFVGHGLSVFLRILKAEYNRRPYQTDRYVTYIHISSVEYL